MEKNEIINKSKLKIIENTFYQTILQNITSKIWGDKVCQGLQSIRMKV